MVEEINSSATIHGGTQLFVLATWNLWSNWENEAVSTRGLFINWGQKPFTYLRK